MTMNEVGGVDGFDLVRDSKSEALLWTELHEPLMFPYLELIEVILQNC